jgi:hypothetical protein
MTIPQETIFTLLVNSKEKAVIINLIGHLDQLETSYYDFSSYIKNIAPFRKDMKKNTVLINEYLKHMIKLMHNEGKKLTKEIFAIIKYFAKEISFDKEFYKICDKKEITTLKKWRIKMYKKQLA